MLPLRVGPDPGELAIAVDGTAIAAIATTVTALLNLMSVLLVLDEMAVTPVGPPCPVPVAQRGKVVHQTPYGTRYGVCAASPLGETPECGTEKRRIAIQTCTLLH